MPLNLPNDIGIGQTEAYEIRTAWATMQQVQSRLATKGIVLSETPPPFPLPEVTTTLMSEDSQEYLRVNAQYLAWLNFILPNLAYIKGCILELQNEKTHIEASYKEQQRIAGQGSKKIGKEEIQDRITLDPRYIELTQAEQECLQEKYFLDAKIEVLERTLRVISRHIEVKKIDMEINRVSPNIPSRFGMRNHG